MTCQTKFWLCNSWIALPQNTWNFNALLCLVPCFFRHVFRFFSLGFKYLTFDFIIIFVSRCECIFLQQFLFNGFTVRLYIFGDEYFLLNAYKTIHRSMLSYQGSVYFSKFLNWCIVFSKLYQAPPHTSPL